MTRSFRAGLISTLLLFPVCLCATVFAQDWPQWRGPERTGAVSEGPALVDSLAEGGFEDRILWESEPILDVRVDGYGNGFGGLGFSTPIVADGRVYLFLNKQMFDESAPAMGWGILNRLGCFDAPLPDDLAARVEAARTSGRRLAMAADKVPSWSHDWVTNNLSYEEYLAFGRQVEDRLMRGPEALDLEVLRKLKELQDRPFETDTEMKRELRHIGLEADLRSKVVGEIFRNRVIAKDIIYCFDLETGATLWKKVYPGKLYNYGTSSTPCVADGRLYVSGAVRLYCFDPVTGEEIWNVPNPALEVHSSPIVENGLLVIQAGSLCAIDTKTGEIRWSRPEFQGTHASPTIWRKDGKSYVVQDRGLVDLESGRLIWQDGNSGESSPVVSGDVYVANLGKSFVGAYKLSPEGGEMFWKNRIGGLGFGKSTPIIYNGHVYVTVAQSGPLICMDLMTGEVKWESPKEEGIRSGAFNTQSCILVDDKIFIDVARSPYMCIVRATPDQFDLLIKDKVVRGNVRSSTPTISDGRLLLRGNEALVCYDLRKDTKVASVRSSEEEQETDSGQGNGSETARTPVDTGRVSVEAGPPAGPEAFAENWPNFRGPGGNATASRANAPQHWDGSSGRNIAWKTALKRGGFSSPVVWGDRLYLTSNDKNSRFVSAYATSDGQLVWEKPVDGVKDSPAELPDVYEGTGYAASSPATDGKRVFAIFGNGDLICFSRDGDRQWAFNLGVPNNHYGYASSLLVSKNRVFVQYDGSENAKILAFDVATGEQQWECEREASISWSSPILVGRGEEERLFVSSSSNVSAILAQDGQLLWNLAYMSGEVACSPAYANGRLYFMNDGADAVAVEPDNGELLWKNAGLSLPDISSPVAAGDTLFWATSSDFVYAADTETGKMLSEWEADAGFSSSPIAIGDKIYFTDITGVTYIFQASGELSDPIVNELGEKVQTTPAFVDDKMFIRADKHLYCIGGEPGK